MWAILFAIFSALAGFGAGAAGLGTPPPGGEEPVDIYAVRPCFEPHPEISLTLTWPDDFKNVPDQRRDLNPSVFGSYPATFDATGDLEDGDGIPECKAYVMNDPSPGIGGQISREFIQVRQNVRIPSCKTDELAGPFAKGSCPDYFGQSAVAARHRGMCTLMDYTDLRKIAQKEVDGQTLEIFWNPFSYNVGCDYRQDENCGPGDRTNINLKDFIAVLKTRDAFDPQSKPQCPALWDAGAANQEACSHFFDIYMAVDLYDRLQNMETTTDPKHPDYFLKQVLENCQEQNLFIPAPEADLYLPPNLIRTPFLAQNAAGANGKIVPQDSFENLNYEIYVWSKPDLINPDTTNLLKSTEITGNVNLCSLVTAPPMPSAQPTIAPLQDCYEPLGQVTLTTAANETGTYNVFSKPSAPQSYFLVDATSPATIYAYTTTEKTYPFNARRDPTLQLNVMIMQAANQWTWFTPWCKPAIYLYPKSPTDINVKLNLDGKLTVANPAYDPQKGWTIRAYPDGTLAQLTTHNTSTTLSASPQPNTQYPYLYYEADLKNVDIPKEGWIIEKSNIKNQISNIMTQIGFNEKEITDFMVYWLPRLQDKPYYFVTLLPESIINQKEKLEFFNPQPTTHNPQQISPDTIIRSRFVFEGLDAPIEVKPLTDVPAYQRNGFVVTDWGGTLVGKECNDVTVK